MKAKPYSFESEKAIIGACLTDVNCIAETQVVIRNEDYFYDIRHSVIWKIISENPMSANIVTLQQKLKDVGSLEQIGGIQYLIECQDSAHSSAHLPMWLKDVETRYVLRRLIDQCAEITEMAYSTSDMTQALDTAERSILSVRPASTNTTDIKSLVSLAIDKLEFRCMNPGMLTGFSTGLIDLDKLTDGIHGGEMIVLAGFPSTGKTALALNIATHCAIASIPALVFTAEMSAVQIAVRQICSTAKANYKKLMESDSPRLISAAGKISNAPIHIQNASGLTIGQLLAMARRFKQKHGIKVIVVDYVQLITGQGDNREQQISNVSKGLKSMAIELDCAVLALSQLTDDGKLRESRAIGQDADSVWKLENQGDWQPQTQPIILRVEKCRDGETGKVDLVFQKTFTRFENASNDYEY